MAGRSLLAHVIGEGVKVQRSSVIVPGRITSRGQSWNRSQVFSAARCLPSCSLGAERHQVGTGQGAIAMTCSLRGTLFGKAAVGNCSSAAVSMMGIAALIWVFESEEMGSRTICE